MQDIGQTITGQYRTSPTIVGIAERFNSAIDPSADIETFRQTCMDLDTASGFGLDYLGRIIGLDRRVKGTKSAAVCGTAIAGLSIVGDATGGSGSLIMDDAEYRTALRLRAYTNITRCTVETMNYQLRTLAAGRGNAWVHDMQRMAITYYFAFSLTALEKALIANTNMLLRPATCEAFVIEAPNTLAICGSAICGITYTGT